MQIRSATIYALQIPFTEAFKHSAKERTFCDSVVVRVQDETGAEGFGEGVPRPYVTGETADAMVDHLARDLWPAIAGRELPTLHNEADLAVLDAFIPQQEIAGALSDNASRAALELALFDCILRRQNMPAAHLMPPRRQRVSYSGVITSGSLEKALQHARQMKLVGLKHIKVKVGMDDDVARLRVVRDTLGPEVSLRIDVNGAWTVDQAISRLDQLAAFDIAAVEQPLARGPIADLVRLKQATSIPLMVDESLVTLVDAEELIGQQAVDYFNLRVSKCGGLFRSLAIARLAARAGIRLQVGSQVGETAILSAAGRHLAAALAEVDFVEGSYSTLLLTEDISADSVRFGHRGEAPLLTGSGLGVRVLEERLCKYARKVVELS
ncbi:MAG: enolase [Deltaproteobacteria bacterium]|nr:enolase [Deltaproteobacteria bacterium]